jgi:hypothetical protein
MPLSIRSRNGLVGFLKKAKTVAEQTALAKRISLLPAGEFPAWIEQSLYQIGRALYDFEHDRDVAHIDDAIAASAAVTALLEEFRVRVGL